MASVKESFLLSESSGDLFVLLLDILPLLGLDEVSSLLEPVDDLTVVVGESDLSNLDWSILVLLESKVLHC